MVNVDSVKPFINPEFLGTIPADYLSALVTGVWDYVQNYTNWPDTKDPPPGLLQCVADSVVYYGNTRPYVEEMKSEDMTLVFDTDLPESIVRRLTVYRRLRW